jgi:hypothetical protein
MNNLDNIRERLETFEYKSANPYMLFLDCHYLLNEVDFQKRRIADLERELNMPREIEAWNITSEVSP